VVVPTSGPFGPRTYLNIHGYTFSDGALGETVPYDMSGNIITNSNIDWYWADVRINSSTATSVWGSAALRPARVEKTARHEIGHVLKLAHPTCTSTSTMSVMRQGWPAGNISDTVVSHDRTALRSKWP